MIYFSFLLKVKNYIHCPYQRRGWGSVMEAHPSAKSLLRLLDDRSTEHISKSKNELMNDPALIMQCKNVLH